MKRRDLLALGLATPALARAMADSGNRPKLALIMDDLGYRERDSYAALELPSALTLAILPHTRHSESLAIGAAAFGHEVMLHLPMQATNGKYMGAGGLSLDMAADEVTRRITAGFASVPGARGFNNHMGSALSQSTQAMAQVMQAGRQHAEYYVDSLTHSQSVGAEVARMMGLKSATRDIFIDDPGDEMSVPERIETLVARQRQVPLVAICHPRPETIDTLQRRWSWLEEHFDLVPASAVVS